MNLVEWTGIGEFVKKKGEKESEFFAESHSVEDAKKQAMEWGVGWILPN